MTEQTVLDRVIEVTARVLSLDAESIKPSDSFVFDLGAESVQSVELVASLEHEFGIDMDEDAALAMVDAGLKQDPEAVAERIFAIYRDRGIEQPRVDIDHPAVVARRALESARHG